MRSRMRGLRAPILLFVTTALAIIVGLLIMGPEWDNLANPSANGLQNMAGIGRNLFVGLVILEAILCGVIAPSLTAGAISLEREQQTLDLLLLTPLSSLNILLSKLLSSLSFAGMVLMCVLPITAISFLLGGVDPAQLCWAFVLILVTVLLFGCMGLYCSTKFPRTSTAAAVAYLTVIVWLALVPVFLGLFQLFYELRTDSVGHLHAAFVGFLAVFAAIFALAPVSLIIAVCSRPFRLVLSRPISVLLWLAFTAVGMSTFIMERDALHQLFSNNFPILPFIGNPIVGLVYLFNATTLTTVQPLTHNFLPFTLVVELLAAWVVLVLTEGELDKLRQ